MNETTTSSIANQPDRTYTIRQASELLGIKTGTLRSYCNRGLITGLRRSHTGYRIFSEDQINQLRNIASLYRCKFGTSEIKRLLRNDHSTKLQILSTKKQQLWQELNETRQNIDFIERQEELITQGQNSTSDIEF